LTGSQGVAGSNPASSTIARQSLQSDGGFSFYPQFSSKAYFLLKRAQVQSQKVKGQSIWLAQLASFHFI
jgi:hypothetical protein